MTKKKKTASKISSKNTPKAQAKDLNKKKPALKAGAKAGAAAKPMAKSTKKPEPKVKLAVTHAKTGKGTKGAKDGKGMDDKSAKLEVKAEITTSASSDEDEEEESPGAGSGMSAAGLAMAAATAGNETSAAGSLKNFRHHPDIENFYRFIFENDLRYEALEIIDVMATQREELRQAKAARARAN
jgi:hypothetical protein